MEDGKRKEDEAAMKMTEQIRSQEEDLMNRINEQNEETRNALLEEFK
jgi:TRAP-type C4-dicarboxylate transport system substrate-binding protein